MNEGNWGINMREFFCSYYCKTLYNNFFFSCLNFQKKVEIGTLQVFCVRWEQLMQMGEVGCFAFGAI
jgi:hypothetical protein